MIDLRSDTVTKPSPEMLNAMMEAKVGDDVFGEDPTINELQNFAANMFGMEAALFCASGTMTNQIAIKLHTQPSDEVICDKLSHVYLYEGGGIGSNSGCSTRLIEGNYGRFTAEQVQENITDYDDIFGELNFIGMISRVQKSGSAQGTHFAPSIDYVLCYAKNKDLVSAFSQPYTDKHIAGFKMSDESGKKYKPKELYQSSLDPMRGCVNQRYFIKAPDNSLIIPPGENFPLKSGDGEQIAPANKNDKVWRWSQKRYLQERENLIFKETKRSPLVNEEGIQSKWSVYTRQYLDEDSGSLPRDFISDFENSQGTTALKKLGLEFSFAKPVGLISHLIEITSKKDPLVLDFFAGSGTTGQAVIELNALDNGNRRFILVTNNEENICTEVCYPRIKKIMKGYVDKTGQKTLGLGGSLRYFRTYFVEKSNNLDELKMRVAEHCKDLIRIREDNFQEFQPAIPEYSIYARENSAFALYSAFEPSKLAELRDTFLNLPVKQRKLYLFAFDDDNLDHDIFDDWSGVQIEPVPQKLIEILGSIDV